ncbi:hypothetical protein HBH98_201010 [Parastagonospora nodorum]|nr:hypothetical protein HBH54_195050 [Parastagonospora nodorum]KAH3940190.1 hypothetical protein HBH53_222640 [Parastagonospora nodorum]KAH4012315.1 hypothetical protein HBI13_191640 [Parastagonospora nodorum]KAH4061886.1 hypothetical protein HBH50_216730 [Parastagonospora nodorum]KAH4130556.1 hypothetical protein HBH45_198990 [Parastagonospora nodorum]
MSILLCRSMKGRVRLIVVAPSEPTSGASGRDVRRAPPCFAMSPATAFQTWHSLKILSPIKRRVIAKPDMPISAPVNLIRHSVWKRAGKLRPGESQSRWQGAALGCQSFSLDFRSRDTARP